MRNPFRRKPKLEPRPCEVLIIEDSDMLNECLGITHERMVELMKALDEAINSSSRSDVMLARASKDCRHHNELAFVAFALGGFVQSAQRTVALKRFLGE